MILRAAIVLIAVADLRAGKLTLPDPATGSINGRTALLFWPVLSTDNPNEPKLLPPQGCHVHLTPEDDPEVEHRFACGRWFQPPRGRYDAWLETTDRISAPWMGLYGGAPSKGGLAAVVPVFAAGHVGIPASRSLPEGEELRILSLDSHLTAKSGRIFERRVRREDASAPVLMPAGLIVIGRFDKKSGDAIALSRPAILGAGAVVRLWPEPPSSGKSDLLVVLRKPSRVVTSAETQLFLDDGERRLAADVILDVTRVIGIWYGVDVRSATISLRAEKMAWPKHEVKLTPGRVSTVRAPAEAEREREGAGAGDASERSSGQRSTAGGRASARNRLHRPRRRARIHRSSRRASPGDVEGRPVAVRPRRRSQFRPRRRGGVRTRTDHDLRPNLSRG
ncbi:MAG TPA: hypothetical protein VGF48_05580 [Thermoanaerobaculia bacterium]